MSQANAAIYVSVTQSAQFQALLEKLTTDDDRQAVVEYMEQTEAQMLEVIEGWKTKVASPFSNIVNSEENCQLLHVFNDDVVAKADHDLTLWRLEYERLSTISAMGPFPRTITEPQEGDNDFVSHLQKLNGILWNIPGMTHQAHSVIEAKIVTSMREETPLDEEVDPVWLANLERLRNVTDLTSYTMSIAELTQDAKAGILSYLAATMDD
ncbi:hypothetical protein DIURU_002578 [Diutina rugosa]|uniref:Uncharacterized protein n=1 Tax=Diutina rugosa TaxID=5481 RepID=A0A642UPK2_DIURU|nr:uncharacterized protein DIURU_002578 [Diutina rugosa]KAA8902977.1 hypothetical protein DIURU_002578 [Diutina rugosa]